MAAVLIYTDEERIDLEKDALDRAIIFCQDMYDAFKLIGLTVPLNEINQLPQIFNLKPERLVVFVKDKLLDKAGVPDFNGVQFNRSLLEAHITMPDISVLQSLLVDFHQTRMYNSNGNPLGIRTNLIDFANETFSKKANADTTLEMEFAYYTKTDNSAVLAGHLNSICDALNNFAAVYPPGLYGAGWGLHFANGGPIPGIVVNLNKTSFMPDLNFIRSKEKLESN